ncbi:hypothetical protein KCU64_g11334, partial [Aureobasidium melanogenum]
LKTGHPVRSAIHKQLNGRLVLRWVTTWESLLLYVLHSLLLSPSGYALTNFLCLEVKLFGSGLEAIAILANGQEASIKLNLTDSAFAV